MKTLRLALLAYLFGSATASPFNLRANSRNHEQLKQSNMNAAAPRLLATSWPGGICPALPDDPTSDGWVLAMPETDDGSSALLDIGFEFDSFGSLFDSTWISNNGYLSFEPSPPWRFWTDSFPKTGDAVVAPFFADVYTRNGNGKVWMKRMNPTRNVFAVAWDNVAQCCYGGPSPVRNTFMVMISDGDDTDMGIGTNVCFCYADIQWPVWSGPTMATVGANKGDGVSFWQFGRFNEAGYGTNGIDRLDGQTICFTTSNTNRQPVAVGVPPENRIELECDGSITEKIITFSGPEPDQLVDITYTITGETFGLEVIEDDKKQTASVKINWSPQEAGNAQLTLTGTDNGIHGTEVDSMYTTVILDLVYPGPCNSDPVPNCNDLEISATSDCQAELSDEDIGRIGEGSSDPDEDSLTLSISSNGPFSVGDNQVVLTVTDEHGASATCSAKVTVIDDEPPQVDCGDVGIIAPCQVPVSLTFGHGTKANGCEVNVDIAHEKCSACNGAGKETSRDCDIDGTTINDSGGVADHISWTVTATNVHGDLSDEKTCTICVQNPSADFNPGCSGNVFNTKGNKYVCDSSCPNCSLHC